MKPALITPLLFGAAALALWQVVVVLWVDRGLLVQLGVTFMEALSGFALASLLAFAIALLFARFPTLECGLFPIAIAIKTTPIIAITPLLVLWQGTGWWSKITAASLICFFPVLVNVVKGLKSVELDFHDLFRSLGATSGQEFSKLRLPFALPYLFSALKISSSLAVVGAIVGEFVGATQGLGYLAGGVLAPDGGRVAR